MKMLGAVASLILLMSPPPADGGVDLLIQCNVGPVELAFAGQLSRVYSCSDGRSLAILSARKSSDTDFTYTILAEGERHFVSGSGSGDGKIVAAVYQTLRKLTRRDIDAIVAATKAQ